MSSYTTFAVAGAGGVGTPIITNLLLLNKTVIILSRTSDTRIEGAETKAIDYDVPATLEEALRGVDVVICALGNTAGSFPQTNLAIAAKKVGVQLFVPTEFGNVTAGLTGDDVHPIMKKKALFHKVLKDLDLPYVLVFTGPFPEMTLKTDPKMPSPINFKGGKLSLVGKGDTQITWTHRDDLGYYLAHALVETPNAKLAWSTLQLQGESKSFNEIAALWEDKIGPGLKLDVTRISIEDAKKVIRVGDGFEAFFMWILLSWEKGETIYEGKIDSQRWPEHKAVKVEDVLRTFL